MRDKMDTGTTICGRRYDLCFVIQLLPELIFDHILKT